MTHERRVRGGGARQRLIGAASNRLTTLGALRSAARNEPAPRRPTCIGLWPTMLDDARGVVALARKRIGPGG